MSIELSELYSTFFRGFVSDAGFAGLRGGVLRVILGRQQGAHGRFCRGISGFLGGSKVRQGDSAHGGHCWVVGAKKFLKTFKKGVKNRKIGVLEGSKDELRAPYVGCAG